MSILLIIVLKRAITLVSSKQKEKKIWLVLAEFLNYSRTKNLNKIRNLGEEIGEWLRGLPSCCTVDFVDYNIVQIGKKVGIL